MNKPRRPMPGKDPNTWQALLNFVASIWPQLYATLLAFVVAMARSLKSGTGLWRSILEATLCGCLTLAIVPVLDHFGMHRNLSVALGATIAFLGTEWVRERADIVFEIFLGRWRK